MTRPIRIHMVRTHWAHLGPHSGLKQYFRYLAKDAFTLYDDPTPFEDETGPRRRWRVRDWLRGLTRRNGMPWYTLGDLKAEWDAGLRVSRGLVDIVHFFDPEHGMQYLPLYLRRRSRRTSPRLMATFHQPADMLPHIVRRDVVALLDHVTLVSPDQEPFFAEILAPDRISMILHGVDAAFFRPAPARRSSARWTCLTVGHNLRDFTTLRAVAQQLPDIAFQVVSPHRTGIEETPNVEVLRDLTDAALLDRYQAADVLFLPLKSATANNALLEGMACGVPVVATDLPAIRAYVPNGSAILVRDNDARVFADTILRLRTDEGLRTRMAAEGRRRAEELRWERVTPSYEDIYRKVLADPPFHQRGRGT